MLQHEGLAYINEDQARRLEGVEVRSGDVLLNITGDSVARVCQVSEDALPARVNQHVAIIRPNPAEIDPRFLRYFMVAPRFQDFLLSMASSGATRDALTKGMIEDFEIPYRPVEEQRKIGKLLGALDDKIDLNRRMSATLEEMARALYRSWFVDFDPVHARARGEPPAHMDPTTAALFPDRFGEDGLPEAWHEEPIIDQASWINGAAYKNMHFSRDPEALPVVKIAELKAGITSGTRFTATDLGSKYLIQRGELLFSWSGNPDTSIDAFVWPHSDGWLNQHIFAVRENGKAGKALLFLMLRFYKPEFAEIARNKQTTGLGHITRKDLEAFLVRIPTADVAKVFEDQIEPLFQRYQSCLYEGISLAALRDAVLPRLMSGELRIRDAERQIEAVA